MTKSSKLRTLYLRWLAVAAFFLSFVLGASSAAAQNLSNADVRSLLKFGTNNILIADQFNNRVIEVDPNTHQIVWQFGTGSDKPGPDSVVGVNDAERVGPYTLIAGTGIPAASPALPGCSTPATGCPDNRVMLVNAGGSIVWQYGQAGVAGPGFNQLDTPVCASIFLGFQRRFGPHVLITDQGNQRVIVVDRSRRIVWQYGTTGTSGNGPNQLNDPNSAQLLDNGNILIADEGNNRVIEVTPDFMIVKQLTAGGTLNGAAFASRLPNGNTLITDANNNRVVEVDPNDAVVWEYATNMIAGSNANPSPTRALRLKNGNTLISDQFNHRVIEVNQAKQIVFQQGQLNVAGNGPNQLNGPYDAKKIGDFTGLTRPIEIQNVIRNR
jgi:outer membrane protein assembly factor BamB